MNEQQSIKISRQHQPGWQDASSFLIPGSREEPVKAVPYQKLNNNNMYWIINKQHESNRIGSLVGKEVRINQVQSKFKPKVLKSII